MLRSNITPHRAVWCRAAGRVAAARDGRVLCLDLENCWTLWDVILICFLSKFAFLFLQSTIISSKTWQNDMRKILHYHSRLTLVNFPYQILEKKKTFFLHRSICFKKGRNICQLCVLLQSLASKLQCFASLLKGKQWPKIFELWKDWKTSLIRTLMFVKSFKTSFFISNKI